MGGLIKSFFGGDDSGSRAAAAQVAGQQSGIDELRRQFGITQENLTPFIEAGTGALPGVIQGTTAGGLDERLAQIFDTDVFGSLVEERQRGVQGQLAAGGLTRSGTAIQEAANIPTSLGLALEQLLTGRGTALAGAGQSAAAGLGQFGAQASGGIANLLQQQGQARSSGIITDAEAGQAGLSNIFGLLSGAGSAVGGLAPAGGTLSKVATAAGIFFSDPALKKNIEPISHIKNLGLFQWDWIEETKGTLIEKCGTIGFMADEVKIKYPQHVSDYCGFLVINYPALLDELEAA